MVSLLPIPLKNVFHVIDFLINQIIYPSKCTLSLIWLTVSLWYHLPWVHINNWFIYFPSLVWFWSACFLAVSSNVTSSGVPSLSPSLGQLWDPCDMFSDRPGLSLYHPAQFVVTHLLMQMFDLEAPPSLDSRPMREVRVCVSPVLSSCCRRDSPIGECTSQALYLGAVPYSPHVALLHFTVELVLFSCQVAWLPITPSFR